MTKNHAADPKIGFLAKSISKSNGYATAMPTAWESTIFKEFQEIRNWKKFQVPMDFYGYGKIVGCTL